MPISKTLRLVSVLCVAVLATACPGVVSPDSNAASQTTLTVSNITNPNCTHTSATGVKCEFWMDVTLHFGTLHSGHITMVTTGLLISQWDNVASADNRTFIFPQSHFV